VRFVPTSILDVVIIEPDVHRDGRGFFVETYHAERYRECGIAGPFVQDNHSRSVSRTLRGLHLQVRHAQGKLIRVIEGEIFDVAAESFKQIYVPPGFAHGFCVVSGAAQVEYKCTDIYDPTSEVGIAWNDPDLGISWPVADPILSPRDGQHPRLAAVSDVLPLYSTDL